MADEARAEALRRAVSTACPERVRVQTKPGSPEGGGSLVPEWVGVAWLVRVRWLRAGQAKRCVERAESRALGVGTGVREESRRQRAGASLERVAGVGEEERPVWMECARCLHGGGVSGVGGRCTGNAGGCSGCSGMGGTRAGRGVVGGGTGRQCSWGTGASGGRGCNRRGVSAGCFVGVKAWSKPCSAWC